MSMNEALPFVTTPVREVKPQRVVQMERMHFHSEEYQLHNSTGPAHMADCGARWRWTGRRRPYEQAHYDARLHH